MPKEPKPEEIAEDLATLREAMRRWQQGWTWAQYQWALEHPDDVAIPWEHYPKRG